MSAYANSGTPFSSDIEREEVSELHRLLKLGPPELVGPDGVDRVPLPASIYKILLDVVRNIREGRAIASVPEEEYVTTQKAADILGMSRPHIVKLLETGAMPFHRIGSHRRVLLKDILSYGRQRDTERRSILKQMTRDAAEAGEYVGFMPEGGEDE